MDTVRIAAAQTLDYRDDISAAMACALDLVAQAEAAGARMICFPEGFLQGYWTDQDNAGRVALALASEAFLTLSRRFAHARPVVVLGMIEREGEKLFNTAAVIEHGEPIGRYRKRHLLAGEGCFDSGADSPVFAVDGLRFGINICSDTNYPEAAMEVARNGASLLVCPANNMMPLARAEAWKHQHNAIRAMRCREAGLWLVSADVTGERDGKVGLGPSAVIDPDGRVLAQLALGRPGLLLVDVPKSGELKQ